MVGASRATGPRWLRRYRTGAWAGLRERASTPKRQPRRLTPEAKLLAIRGRRGRAADPERDARLARLDCRQNPSPARSLAFRDPTMDWFAEQGVAVETLMPDNDPGCISRLARPLSRALHASPAHAALRAAHHPQGRALYPDAVALLGLRPPLSLQRPPRPPRLAKLVHATPFYGSLDSLPPVGRVSHLCIQYG